MLLVGFSVGSERYAMDASRIVEIVPRVKLRRIPLADHYVAGILDYRGTLVPVIDLCQLLEQRECSKFMSTRIILAELAAPHTGARMLGLAAEQITDTFKQDPGHFKDPGIETAAAPFLGRVARDSKGTVQYVDPERLLPEDLLQQLFARCDEQSQAAATGD